MANLKGLERRPNNSHQALLANESHVGPASGRALPREQATSARGPVDSARPPLPLGPESQEVDAHRGPSAPYQALREVPRNATQTIDARDMDGARHHALGRNGCGRAGRKSRPRLVDSLGAAGGSSRRSSCRQSLGWSGRDPRHTEGHEAGIASSSSPVRGPCSSLSYLCGSALREMRRCSPPSPRDVPSRNSGRVQVLSPGAHAPRPRETRTAGCCRLSHASCIPPCCGGYKHPGARTARGFGYAGSRGVTRRRAPRRGPVPARPRCSCLRGVRPKWLSWAFREIAHHIE
jgi:hypothetical protein